MNCGLHLNFNSMIPQQPRWKPGDRPDLIGRPLVPFFAEDDSVNEGDEDDVEDDLPEHFTDDVGRVECDGDDFVPEGDLFFAMSSLCEVIDYHSQKLTRMRTIRNN